MKIATRAGAHVVTIAVLSMVSLPVFADAPEITGRVISADDTPVAEALVFLTPAHGPAMFGTLALEGGLTSRVADSTLTSEDGSFSLTAPHAGMWIVQIEGPGSVPIRRRLTPLLDRADLPEIRLEPDRGTVVRVLDPGGSPVEGALVLAQPVTSGPRLTRWTPAPFADRTGPEGTIWIPRRREDRLSISASAPRFASAAAMRTDRSSVDLSLEKTGGSVPIRVVDSDKQPAMGVLISSDPASHPEGVTDEGGATSLQLPIGSERSITASHPDGRRVEARVSPQRDDNGEIETRTLQLPPAIDVSGKVIDSEYRSPVGGAVVWARGDRAAITDGQGRFALRVPAAGTVELHAATSGTLETTFRGALPRTGQSVTLTLEPAAIVSGAVVDADGKSVEDARLTLVPSLFRPGQRMRRPTFPTLIDTRSGKDGKFRIGQVPPGAGQTLTADAEGFARTVIELPLLEARKAKTVRVVLRAGVTVTGLVADPEGTALADAVVMVSASMSGWPPSPADIAQRLLSATDEESASMETSTDVEGRFVVDKIPPGKHDVVVRLRGYAYELLGGITLEESAEAVDLGEIVLEPGVRLVGFVTDTHGNVVDLAEVFNLADTTAAGGRGAMGGRRGMGGGPGGMARRFQLAGREPDALSAADGYFEIDGLRSGESVSLFVRRAGFLATDLSGVSVPSAEPVRIALAPGSTVSGVVLDPDGYPVAGADVSVSPMRVIGGRVITGRNGRDGVTDDRGEFRVEEVAPGKIAVRVFAAGWQEVVREGLTISSGEDLTDLEIGLEPETVVEGRVVDGESMPAVGARVAVVVNAPMMGPRGGSSERSTGTDGDGRFRLGGLSSGPVSIEAVGADGSRAVRDVELEPGLNTLNLSFAPGYEVSGQVIGPDGMPVPGARIVLAPGGSFRESRSVDSEGDGLFRFEQVVDGPYELRAVADGYAGSPTRAVQVAGQPLMGLELQMTAGAAVTGRVLGLEPNVLPTVTVAARMPGGPMRSTSADHEGIYRIENLPAGVWTVEATAGAGKQVTETVIVPEEPTEVQLDLEFGLGLTLRGQVTQADYPLVGTRVSARGLDVQSNGQVETDQDGRFAIEGLDPGEYQVSVLDWASGLSHQENVTVDQSREIVVEIPTARIHGRVTDGITRDAVSGATVSLARDGTGGPPMPRMSFGEIAGEDGSFEIRDVGDGDFTLSVEAEGYAAARVSVNVALGHDVPDVKVALEPTEGLVLDVRQASGGFPSTVNVAVLDAGGALMTRDSLATGENGRVRLDTVPAGFWTVLVSAAGSAVLALETNAPGGPLPVTLPLATTLKIVIPDIQDDNETATISAKGSDGRRLYSLGRFGVLDNWRTAGGQVQLDFVPSGTWQVTAATADGRRWQATVTTEPGARTEVVLD